MKTRFFLSFFGLLFTAVQLFAQYSETIVSDRPGQSDSPYTVGTLVLQVQTGLQYDGARFDNFKSNGFAWPAFIRFGITDRIELETLWGYQSVKAEFYNRDYTAKGINLSSFGMRFNIFEETENAPALGFAFSYNTKLLSSDYKPDYPWTKLNLMATKSLSDIFSITSNLGVNFDGNGGAPVGFYTLNCVLAIDKSFSVFLENYGNFDSNSFDTYFDGGLAYLMNNNLQLDLYGGFGYNDEVFQSFISGGVSYRIVKWRKE